LNPLDSLCKGHCHLDLAWAAANPDAIRVVQVSIISQSGPETASTRFYDRDDSIYCNQLGKIILNKKIKPDTKLIIFPHVWEIINDENHRPTYDFTHEYFLRSLNQLYDDLFIITDKIICLNYKTNDKPLPKFCDDNFINGYHPMDDATWKIETKWSDRKKNFCYIGNILPHKVSEEFIRKIKDTDIQIDCYGNTSHTKGQYKELFESASSNIVYKGLINQDDVPSIMNEYKYFVMSHEGYEPFNCVLLQCILCGTIPLVCNDRNTKRFDPTWIDWAKDLYFGCNTVDELIDNIKLLEINNPNQQLISENISNIGHERFNYKRLKNIVINILKDYTKKE
jgi:glycosyltransferase involved in cell wall biosynthesis